MNTVIAIAEATLLEANQLSHADLERTMAALCTQDTTLADLYFESSRNESWSLSEGIIKSGSYSISQGVGVRNITGEKTGFAYSDAISADNLLNAAKAASAITPANGLNVNIKCQRQENSHALYQFDDPIDGMAQIEKIALLQAIDEHLRSKSPHIEHVNAHLNAIHNIILIMNEQGQLHADVRPLVRLDVSVIVSKGGKTESAHTGGGGRGSLNTHFDLQSGIALADEALRQAMVNLEARSSPAGSQTVVLGPGWPGILLHEAVGHGLEGDFNRKGTSAFSGRIGQRVAAKGITVVDDGTLPGRRGSLSLDDEGTQTQCTTLIEDGILTGYMMDRQNAALMNQKSTGNGRRESYAHLPMPRMTNTYMLDGNYPQEEIIASVKDGVYAVNFSGGQVDITSGKFVFSSAEAYRIENGKITHPIKNATLIGNGPDVLTRVSMIGNDMALDHGVGVCGKDGQGVPVGVGQPTLKIDGLTVGGTAA